MRRIDRAALRVVALWLGLGAALVLSACGGGGGGGEAPTPVPPAVVAPSIGVQPADAKVTDGATTTFNVSATGTSLSYQWQRDGKSIAGATGTSYTTPVLHMADNGAKFQVVVSGPNTSVTSSTVTLTVSPIALNLTAQPQAQTAKDGEVVTFDVGATGSEPIQYQWQRDGVVIAGADKASFTTAALTLGDSNAVFRVVVTNPAGSVTSQDAKLTVTAVAPRIVSAPESITTTDGSSVTFKVVAAGSAPLAYQWLRNGSPISGATDASYSTTLAYASSGDGFSVRISNGAGQIVSDAAVATVNAAAPAIGQHPADVSIATAGRASFSVAASGTAPLRFQWQQSQDEGLSWTDIAGATSASYALGSATLADANTLLRVVVGNQVSVLNSNAARLTVKANVRILAGTTGGSGYADGRGNLARFGYGFGMGADAQGNVYLADNSNSVIRRVAPDGTVKLYAGEVKTIARIDGALADARFVYPSDVAVDRTNGTVYVVETCTLRRIAAGMVDTLVGSGNCETRDGAAGQASVAQINGLAVDAAGNVFISERSSGGGQLLRKITPQGSVSTLAGSATQSGSVDGVGAAARFFNIGRLVLDADNNIYVADGTAIRLVTPAGAVTTFAGAPDSWGQTEGYRTSARFGYISGLAFDGRGNLFVADNQRIARISTFGNVVTAVAYASGNDGAAASNDGPSGTASAGNPSAMTGLPSGNIAYFDAAAYTVRTVTPEATVTTLAGGGRGGGFADGVGTAARYAAQSGNPLALIVAPNGVLNLADAGNHRIRRLALDTRKLDTVAGTPYYGFEDGPVSTATLGNPIGLVYDAAGNLYVGDSSTIRRISTFGVVSTVAGKAFDWLVQDGVGAAARFSQAGSMVMDSKGNLIVAESSYSVLRRVAPNGAVTTIAGKKGEWGYVNGMGAEARLGYIKYLAIDKADNVYFTDGFQSIRKMTPDGEVTTLAGAPYSAALIDDLGAFARFSNPAGLAFDARGNLYVADSGNNAIRRITPGGQVSTVIGSDSRISALQPGLGGNINQPTAIAVTPAGRLVFLSEGAIVGD